MKSELQTGEVRVVFQYGRTTEGDGGGWGESRRVEWRYREVAAAIR